MNVPLPPHPTIPYTFTVPNWI